MLVKKILEIGNYNKENENRLKISILSSSLGLFFNLILAILKVLLFISTQSVSILADAINNLTDSISSIVTIIGAKLSEKPADEDHPYGHGRIEYISAFVVAVFVLLAGIEFIKVSVNRIMNPKVIEFDTIAIVLMSLSIFVKLYMSIFYNKIFKKINSLQIKAQSKDSLADVVVTGVVIVSILIYKLTGYIVDGYAGLIVSLFIIYSGYELISDTISELIGQVPIDLLAKVEEDILKYDSIKGVHDMVIVNYGPQRKYLSLDVEMDYSMSLLDAHTIIDRIEEKIEEKYDIILSIHTDPVGIYSKEEKIIIEELKKIINENKKILSFHDISHEGDVFKLDIVIDGNTKLNEEEEKDLKKFIEDRLSLILNCNYIINIDRYFL
ncbi:MAG: cation diffusion facilitator family transporter [Peptoniphilaceae bacterium]